MAKPSVLCSAGNPLVSAADGRRYLLNNGKQVVIALQKVAEEVDLTTLPDLDWCVDDLEETFTTGLHVDFVEYPDPDDRDAQVAFQVFSHEVEQNRYRPSSIGDKINITKRIHQKSAGGDWSTTQKNLQNILGETKKSTCYRWICLARDLDWRIFR